MLASFTNIPEIEMEQKEAEEIAKAAAEVAKHYPALDMAPKAVDWANLIICVGTAYGSRYAAYRMRLKAETSAPPHGLQIVQ